MRDRNRKLYCNDGLQYQGSSQDFLIQFFQNQPKKKASSNLHQNTEVVIKCWNLLFASLKCRRNEILGFQLGICHVAAPLNFLRSISPASLFPGTRDVIRCVNFHSAVPVHVPKIWHSLSCFLGDFIQWRKILRSRNTSFPCDVETLQLTGRGEGSFHYICSVLGLSSPPM